MREFNPRGDLGPLLACATSLMLTACASHAPQAQFLPSNFALTTGGVESCDPRCPQQTSQTDAVPSENRPTSISWKSSVVVQPPFEYQPYQGEHDQPTDAQPLM